ncbi:hypothetical protein BSKO_09122 [Bryopsis sp. KO-2023]|nr:hypothetical protein BSKO_09122 [Bryopsis sp. KO-2023]
MDPFFSTFWKPLALSTDWMDVKPVSMEEGDDPVVCIEYGESAGEVMSYLYAMTNRGGESSDRALELSRKAVLCNLSGYTAWAFRRMILEGSAADNQDRDFSEGVLESMPKNYQLWNHRRRLAECLVDAGAEDLDYDFDFAKRALEGDAKNYHAWAHRQALLVGKDGAMLEKEREYAETLVDLDVHNNSAWTQKAFVLEKSLEDVKDVTDACESLFADRELPYVSEKIKLAPHNGASWSYLYGLMTNEKLSQAFWKKSNDVFGLVFGVLKDWPSCPAAMDFLGQMYGRLADMHARRENWSKARKAGSNAIETWGKLQVVDPIRAGYYRHMIHLMSARLQSWPE